MEYTKTCKRCGNEFEKPYTESKKNWVTHIYCSRACCYPEKVIRVCLQCGIEFSVRGKRKFVANFCSYKCKSEYQIGKPNTSTTKFAEGFTPWNKGTKGVTTPWNKGIHTGVVPSNVFKKGNIPVNKGKKLLHLRGENACHWKDGVTAEYKRIRNSTEFSDWRKRIWERDRYTCQRCEQYGGYLIAHHIINFATNSELRMDESNGITLCKKCHLEFHSIYSTRNNTKEQLEEFISNGVLTLT